MLAGLVIGGSPRDARPPCLRNGQKFVDDEAKSVYWRLGVLRAVLISAAGRPALGQRAIGPVDKTETVKRHTIRTTPRHN